MIYTLNCSFENLGSTVESFTMDLEFEGIYRSWPLLKTNIVTDRPSFPMFVSTFTHFITLEVYIMSYSHIFFKLLWWNMFIITSHFLLQERIKILAEDYIGRSKYFIEDKKYKYKYVLERNLYYKFSFQVKWWLMDGVWL